MRSAFPLAARPALLAALLLGALLLGTLGSPAGHAAPGPAPFPYVRGALPMPKPRPGEATVLTLETARGPLPLTLSQLRALSVVRYATEQPQLGRTFTYEGAALRDLAAWGGFGGRDLRVMATNGFAATIRAADYLNHPIMLAYRADGRPISPLHKGPLTVVLPPQPARFSTGSYSAAWVWFAERLAPAP
ncbi:hypothetical protein [Deinococcus multiflagellatus]|uniref:hypothetical protein n=1 Tax=Deinococcus multiflagellatus TaxID=1656887 RepID=UPI001CCB3DBC|nr:hypothetical protein [Deinococcus multiflagellatus]MBZ9713131.1 hypothetical protein [Deinococcus multiflagellatus]